jgi:single-strand DNA-binding protein
MPTRVREEPPAEPGWTNEVTLSGRVSAAPEERELPSGDRLMTLRLVVPRPPLTTGRGRNPERPRSTVDTIDCAVWVGRVRRSVASWRPDDLVEVSGALRRRFFRAGGATVSRVEVEVTAARLIRRASA